jgi:hypothetical protein
MKVGTKRQYDSGPPAIFDCSRRPHIIHFTSNHRIRHYAFGFVPSEYPTFMSVSILFSLFLMRSSSNWIAPLGNTTMTVLPPYAK